MSSAAYYWVSLAVFLYPLSTSNPVVQYPRCNTGIAVTNDVNVAQVRTALLLALLLSHSGVEKLKLMYTLLQAQVGHERAPRRCSPRLYVWEFEEEMKRNGGKMDENERDNGRKNFQVLSFSRQRYDEPDRGLKRTTGTRSVHWALLQGSQGTVTRDL